MQSLNLLYIQVSQLIVLNEAYDSGSGQNFPDHLLDNVSTVQKSIEHLVSVSERINLEVKDNVSKVQLFYWILNVS